MSELILTEEQAKIVRQALGPVTVRDSSGTVLGHIEPIVMQALDPVALHDASGTLVGHFEPELTPETIAELKRRARSPGPRYTGAQVQARLQALQEEWDRTGGFDETYMREFLARLDVADPGHMRPKRHSG
jgi:hypothetical protein